MAVASGPSPTEGVAEKMGSDSFRDVSRDVISALSENLKLSAQIRFEFE